MYSKETAFDGVSWIQLAQVSDQLWGFANTVLNIPFYK
jgi:hypothetical protein